MAIKKVKAPKLAGEEKAVQTPAVEEVETVEEVVEATEAEAVETEEVVEETKEEKAPAKKATTAKKEKASTKKTTPAKEKKEAAPKKEAKSSTKKVGLKSVKETEAKEVVEGNRATRKKVIKMTQEFLETNADVTISQEDLSTIITAFENVLEEVTNTQSFKFMNGMIKVQERNGQVYKSPKVEYHSYKAPRVVKTFTADTEETPKYQGEFDKETGVFHATGQWNYDTKEFDEVDIEIQVPKKDSK